MAYFTIIYMIVGVDEVGRGCLIGSVVAAAVILPSSLVLNNLKITDSKKLTAKNREQAFNVLISNCKYAIGSANSIEIDNLNILNATMLAMKRAVIKLNVDYVKVLVDGNKCPNIKNCTAIIGGDISERVISAASIIAKVTRDKQMILLDKKHPQYGFARHKGYGTKEHIANIKKYGILSQHRKTFSPVKLFI